MICFIPRTSSKAQPMARSTQLFLLLAICTLITGYCCAIEQSSHGHDPLTPVRPNTYAPYDGAEGVASADLDQEKFRRVFPALLQLARNRAKELQWFNRRDIRLGAGEDGDVYHPNIDLDNLNNNFEIAPPAERFSVSQAGLGYDGDKMTRLVARWLSSNKANEFRRHLKEKKRNLNHMLNQKEDKDYSFVGASSVLEQQPQQPTRGRTGRWANEAVNSRDTQVNGPPGDG